MLRPPDPTGGTPLFSRCGPSGHEPLTRAHERQHRACSWRESGEILPGEMQKKALAREGNLLNPEIQPEIYLFRTLPRPISRCWEDRCGTRGFFRRLSARCCATPLAEQSGVGRGGNSVSRMTGQLDRPGPVRSGETWPGRGKILSQPLQVGPFRVKKRATSLRLACLMDAGGGRPKVAAGIGAPSGARRHGHPAGSRPRAGRARGSSAQMGWSLRGLPSLSHRPAARVPPRVPPLAFPGAGPLVAGCWLVARSRSDLRRHLQECRLAAPIFTRQPVTLLI